LVLPRSLARRLRDLSGCLSLPSEGLGRQVAQGRVRPLGVVVDPPRFNPLPRIGKGKEPAGVEALGSDARVESLDERIIRGRSWPGEVQFDAVQVCPLVEQAPGELWAIIDPYQPVAEVAF
jgi:hypothetical protein